MGVENSPRDCTELIFPEGVRENFLLSPLSTHGGAGNEVSKKEKKIGNGKSAEMVSLFILHSPGEVTGNRTFIKKGGRQRKKLCFWQFLHYLRTCRN